MLPARLLFFRTKLGCACVRGTRPFDFAQGRLFAKCAKDGAPSVPCLPAIKSPGHPPKLLMCFLPFRPIQLLVHIVGNPETGLQIV